MKTSLICLAIAIGLRLALSQGVEVYNAFGKEDDFNWKNPVRQIFVSGGNQGRWLTIVRWDTEASKQHGFSPNYSYAISKLEPVITQLPNGMYQISFICENCQP